MLKKSGYIEAYTNEGGVFCRTCVAEILEDVEFEDPYCNSVDDDYTPVFASDVEQHELEEMVCEHCFQELA